MEITDTVVSNDFFIPFYGSAKYLLSASVSFIHNYYYHTRICFTDVFIPKVLVEKMGIPGANARSRIHEIEFASDFSISCSTPVRLGEEKIFRLIFFSNHI